MKTPRFLFCRNNRMCSISLMATPPSAFCSICTRAVKNDLIGSLFSLSIQHPEIPVYLFVDGESNSVIEEIRPCLRLNLHVRIALNEWRDSRNAMERAGSYNSFMMQKMHVMEWALLHQEDVCFIDTDVLLLEPILVDRKYEMGVSPHRIREENHRKYGLYNGGILWTRDKKLPERWKVLTKTVSRFYDQASVENLTEEFSYFMFGEEYNVGWWKVEENTEPPVKMLEYFEAGSDGKPLFKGKPIVFVHTHFFSNDKIVFNNFIFYLLMKCARHRECCLIHRMQKGKWTLTLPKQPMPGIWQHNDDSFRELARIWSTAHSDLELVYSSERKNCFLEPNVCLYDRDNLDWLTSEVQDAHFVLFGNPSIQDTQSVVKASQSPWIFWSRHPMVLEDFIKTEPLKGFEDRICESVFLGNVENNVQAKHRLATGDWSRVVERFELLPGALHRYSQREYLSILAKSRFGLSLRGFGAKCNREIELMALGTVPVMGPLCDGDSYIEPLIEGVHYLRVSAPEQFPSAIRSVDKEGWTRMSEACKSWYTRNAHSSKSWERTIRRIMYQDK